MLVIDTNNAETFLFEICGERGIPTERRRLDVGDMEIVNGDMRLVIERKSWSDLAGSICDGRFHEQKTRMIQDEGTTTTYAYVIEGTLPDWKAMPFGRMNMQALWGAVIKTQMRDSMPVFHTCDKLATADLLIYLYRQFMEGGFQVSANHAIAGVNNVKRKRDNLNSPDSVYTAMLSVIPGMSYQKAEALRSAFPTIRQLTTSSIDDISKITINQRKFGPVLAKRIHDTFSR